MSLENFDEELFCDTETYSEVPINFGTHAYAEAAEIMTFQYAFGDDPVTVLDFTRGDKLPKRVARALTNPRVLKVFHNGMFDLNVIAEDWDIKIPIEQVHDTMIQALAHSLPGGLDKLCAVLGVARSEAKDKDGKRLINLFCKPRPKNQKLRRATYETHPKDWNKFLKYGGRDIKAMRAIKRKMPMWNYRGVERELANRDFQINMRGFAVDLDLARAAIAAIDLEQQSLGERIRKRTRGKKINGEYEHKDGLVEKATQRDRLLKYIADYHGVYLPDMRKATLERILADNATPRGLRELLSIRLDAATTSTGKYKKLLQSVSADGRLRCTMQFCGASRTSRWAGRVFQPQNLPRPKHKNDVIEKAIVAIKGGYAHLTYTDLMSLISSCIRGCIVAPKGKKLYVSDLSNIEGRAAAWLAGEDWKIEAFKRYDTFKRDKKGNKIPDPKKPGEYLREGADLYVLAYARAFDVDPEDVTSEQRQVGKVLELFMQYEGGVGAFLTGAATYNIDLDKLAAVAWPNVPKRFKNEARGNWDWTIQKKRSTFGLSKKTYMTCFALSRMWRDAHPAISSYWKELSEAARKAILQPGKTFVARRVKFRRKGAWLRMLLPSGRSLCYASPRVSGRGLSYAGVRPYSRQWGRIDTYGGKFFENLCQKIARDVMADNMPDIEAAGYAIILSVHDELLTEANDNGKYSARGLSRLLAKNRDWSKGMPLAAGGFESYRYKKG